MEQLAGATASRDQILSHARIGSADIFQFAAPVGDWVALGDTLSASPAATAASPPARRSSPTSVNFRGFPHIPGNDFVLSYPKAGAVLNGRAAGRMSPTSR